MGCAVLVMELFYKEEMMVDFTEAQKEWSRSFGGWIYVLWGIAVFSGIGGSIGLLMRKECTRCLLDISLAAVLIQMSYTMALPAAKQSCPCTRLRQPKKEDSKSWVRRARSAIDHCWHCRSPCLVCAVC